MTAPAAFGTTKGMTGPKRVPRQQFKTRLRPELVAHVHEFAAETGLTHQYIVERALEMALPVLERELGSKRRPKR